MCTPPPHISSFEEILPHLTRRTLSQLRTTNLPSSNHTYTKSTPKHIHHHYAPSVTSTHIISSHKYMLNKNIIPHTWKLANIVPIPKHYKDTNKGTSYRPISLLSVIAKTLEKSLIPYITANTLHTLNNTIAKGFNQMAPPVRIITVALNMSIAFNTINSHTLIRKLLQTNIPGTH